MRTATVWLCLLLYLLTGTLGPARLVLCLEPGGAFALEIQGTGCACDGCRTEESARRSNDDDAFAGPSPCRCVDIPLLLARDENVHQTPTDRDLAFAPPPPAAWTSVERDWPRSRWADPDPPEPPRAFLTHLRSVVMLI